MKIEDIIYTTIKTSITQFFSGKDVKVEHVLDLIFPKERRIRSLIGGLETSLGTRLWEPLAKAFAKENGFSILDEKTLNAKVPVIPDNVRHFISDFENKKIKDNKLTHDDFIKDLRKFITDNKILTTNFQKMPKGQGVDVWLKKNDKEYLIDIKTTQINAGSGPKFNTNMLNWYAYRALVNPNIEIKCLLAFPFNPHKGKDFWEKEGGKALPLIASNEAVVADEFWDFLYGKKHTTKLIFKEFEKLGKNNFGKQFEKIFEPNK